MACEEEVKNLKNDIQAVAQIETLHQVQRHKCQEHKDSLACSQDDKIIETMGEAEESIQERLQNLVDCIMREK